jgi:hypothetical protein
LRPRGARKQGLRFRLSLLPRSGFGFPGRLRGNGLEKVHQSPNPIEEEDRRHLQQDGKTKAGRTSGSPGGAATPIQIVECRVRSL